MGKLSKLLVMILGFILVACTQPEEITAANPPEGWDHVPIVDYLEYILPYEDVNRNCFAHSDDYWVEGCSAGRFQIPVFIANPRLNSNIREDVLREFVAQAEYPTREFCVIILPELGESRRRWVNQKWEYIIVTQASFDLVQRHEWTHCNGLIHNPRTGLGWYRLTDGAEIGPDGFPTGNFIKL